MPRSHADNTHGRIMGSPGAGSAERGYGCRRIWHVPRANAEGPPNAVPSRISAGMFFWIVISCVGPKTGPLPRSSATPAAV